MKETFVLPDIPDAVKNSPDHIVIVSVIGKSAYSSSGNKTPVLSKQFAAKSNFSKEKCLIEGCYDDEQRIVYLHLYSLMDTSNFIEHYSKLVEECRSNEESTNFLSVYNLVKDSVTRAFLLLFHISHIIVLYHPGSSFDINFVQIFKALDNIRQKKLSFISDILSKIPNLDSAWIRNGRPRNPSMIFYFDRCPMELKKNGQTPDISIKRLEHRTEDRIYHILRKSRLVGGTNYNSLFVIPHNQEFVYINDKLQPLKDKLAYSVQSLIESCLPNSGTVNLQEFPFSCQPESYSKTRSFAKFLKIHTNQAFLKGFDVIVGRHNNPSFFEVPTTEQWSEVVEALYPYFMQPEGKDNDLGEKDFSVSHTDTKFSDLRCDKKTIFVGQVKPLAVGVYLENLPRHYSRTVHEVRLNMALASFALQARGPLFDKVSQQVAEICNGIWNDGRQLCEYPSLTGNPCTKPQHDGDGEHCSGVRYVAACNCGKKQGCRDDPYTAKLANFVFYQTVGQDCDCGSLDRIHFPVFEPSTKDFKPGNVGLPKSVQDDDASDLSEGSDLQLSAPSASPLEKEVILELVDREAGETSAGLIRQPSTTEYLPGMLTTSSPASLLPRFASWSLVCLGPSSLYSHNIGLCEKKQPGFLSGANFLIPWDVTVRSARTNWANNAQNKGQQQQSQPQQQQPQLQQQQQNALRPRRTRTGGATAQFVVKIFLGYEYECPYGHRFMLSAPDKVLRGSPGNDLGLKLTASDMPLYFLCPCRSNNHLVAQLMRVHVVTPKAPVNVTLSPKVQPAADAPIFIPTSEIPVKLSQSAYWVLRLPYVYATERDSYLKTRLTADSAAKLLQGMWGVAHIE